MTNLNHIKLNIKFPLILEAKMRLLLSGLIIISLLFTACDQITEPTQVTGQLVDNQSAFTSGKTTDEINFSIIPLPEKSPVYLDSIFTVTKLINGLLGGKITLDKVYISKEGKLVTILVDLVIPPLAFLGQKDITLTIEDSVAVMNCGPSMNFRRPLVLIQTFTGLDLMNYNTNKIDFVYIHNDGTFSPVPRVGIIVNKQLGLVSVIGAKINHFSKYGWVR